MSDSEETVTDSEEEYDAFNQFCNGDPLRIIDWIRMGKVKVDACDGDHGDTLLLWAARHRVEKLARFVVRKGCDVNYVSNVDGQTALDICWNDAAMSQYLREHGAKTAHELWEGTFF
jgi:hypothetical protein